MSTTDRAKSNKVETWKNSDALSSGAFTRKILLRAIVVGFASWSWGRRRIIIVERGRLLCDFISIHNYIYDQTPSSFHYDRETHVRTKLVPAWNTNFSIVKNVECSLLHWRPNWNEHELMLCSFRSWTWFNFFANLINMLTKASSEIGLQWA